MSLENYMRSITTTKNKYIKRITTDKTLHANIDYLDSKYDTKDADYTGRLVDSVNISKLLTLLKDLTDVVKPYIKEGKPKPDDAYCTLMSELISYYSVKSADFINTMSENERNTLKQYAVIGLLATNTLTDYNKELFLELADKYRTKNYPGELTKVLNSYLKQATPENLQIVHRFFANELSLNVLIDDIKTLTLPIAERKIVFENITSGLDKRITSKLEKAEDMVLELHNMSTFLKYALVEWFSVIPVSITTEVQLLKLHSFILKTDNDKNELTLMKTELNPNMKNLLTSFKTISGVIANNILGSEYSRSIRVASELGLELDNDYWLSTCLSKPDMTSISDSIDYS